MRGLEVSMMGLGRHSVAVAVAVLALAMPTMAGEWYIGASYVQSELQAQELDVRFDADDKGFSVFAGQDVSRFFALEASYVDLGSPSAESMGFLFNSEATAFALALHLNVPLGRKLEAYGRGGYAYWKIETQLDDGSSLTSTSDSDYDMTYGVGLRLKINENIALRAGYDKFKIEMADDIQAASLGAEFRF